MKKIFAAVLALVMLFSLCACSKKESAGDTDGQKLCAEFKNIVKANGSIAAYDVAEKLLQNEEIDFFGMAMPVEPGYLAGLGNAEIDGFDDGAMFAPMIGSIPFVGYVFHLANGTDAKQFVKTLEDNADTRWNICVEAEELVVAEQSGYVFMVMCNTDISEVVE